MNMDDKRRLKAVAAAVEKHTGKTWEDLCGRGGPQRLSLVRKMAAAVMREVYPGMSLREIGNSLGGRDHSTVTFWLRTMEKIVQEDPMYRGVLQNIYRDVQEWRDAERALAFP